MNARTRKHAQKVFVHPSIGTKKKSGKHQTRSKEQQQQDAADALAEQEALALPEVGSDSRLQKAQGLITFGCQPWNGKRDRGSHGMSAFAGFQCQHARCPNVCTNVKA
eukprot:1159921-Pelagomonas_calceolata.AAC.2